MKNNHKPLLRHFYKTISYRVLGTTVTIITAYCCGLSLKMSSLLGVGELIIKPVLYFSHERIWYKYFRIKN
jgi:uncharacterized membrane protein